ncbi:MAG: hypothetical protein Q7J29_13920 [Stagnimonas sp.]|nr:hypothetical protein [Stagnimonas sp.]
MEKKALVRLLDYIPSVISFAAAVAAVVGSPKWDSQASGFAKITPYGWGVMAIGATALAASLLIIKRNQKDQTIQRATRERIAAIGKARLLKALGHAVHPFWNYSIWERTFDVPESPLDLLDPERRKALASLNLNSKSPYSDGTDTEFRWFNIIENAAEQGSAQLTTALQIYSAYLPAEVMDAVTKVLYSTFLNIRLIGIHGVVAANTRHDRDWPVKFFWVANDEMHNRDYSQFWQLLAAAFVACGSELSADGKPMFPRY